MQTRLQKECERSTVAVHRTDIKRRNMCSPTRSQVELGLTSPICESMWSSTNWSVDDLEPRGAAVGVHPHVESWTEQHAVTVIWLTRLCYAPYIEARQD